MENPIAAILARISSPGQLDGTSLDTQVEQCWAEAERLGYRVDPDLVWREVWTGEDLERPTLDDIRAVAKSGRFNALVVFTYDRLARDPLYVLMVAREFREMGVALLFVNDPSDDSPEGQLLMYINGYVGFRERQQIAERTMRGKERVAQNGRLPNGTGSGLYGYDYDPVTKVRLINEAEAAPVRLMFQWVTEGVSCYQVAVRLNDANIPTKRGKRWHPLGVKRIIRNRAYTGCQFYGEKALAQGQRWQTGRYGTSRNRVDPHRGIHSCHHHASRIRRGKRCLGHAPSDGQQAANPVPAHRLHTLRPVRGARVRRFSPAQASLLPVPRHGSHDFGSGDL